MEERWDDQDEEELPADVVEGDWASDEDDDVGEVEAHHTKRSTCSVVSTSMLEVGFGSGDIP